MTASLVFTCAGCDSETQTSDPMESQAGHALSDPPEHGFLGVTFASIDELPLVIKGTVPGSGASRIGLEAGDLLLAVAEQEHPSLEEILIVLRDTSPGDTVSVTISHHGQPRDLDVELLSYQEVEQSMSAAQDTDN